VEAIAGLVRPRRALFSLNDGVLTSTAAPAHAVPFWQRRVGSLRQNPGPAPEQAHRVTKIASDLVNQRPSNCLPFSPATNSCHSPRLNLRHVPPGSGDLHTMTISPNVLTWTHAPLSHRLEVRHIGSSAVVTPTTTPNGHQKQDALLTQTRTFRSCQSGRTDTV
jgi:hypothetical protein